MKHLLKVTGEVASADYDRILLNEDGSIISQLGGGVKPIEYQAIDLGLPSGLKWCNMNVGASSPEETGLYFQWGDTVGYTAEQVGTGEGQKKFSSDWSDYKFGTYPDFTKYTGSDGKLILDPEDDAARANMGGFWRMPTHEEFRELINNTTSEWVENYKETGVNGRLFTLTNGNSIFVPAAVYAYDGSVYVVGNEGNLWSSSLHEVGALTSHGV